VHGYVKPDGHYMDDLWFYDFNGHRWICCYPGADTKDIALKINEEGFEVDETGQPIPVAAMVHAYENLTYDSDRGRFMFMPCSGEYWKKSLGERRSTWMKEAKKVSNASPWMFDARSGRWERRVTKEKIPPSGFGDVFVYVPAMKKSFFWHGEGVWFYDGERNSWEDAGAKGKRPGYGIDPTACYDGKRERIYMGGGSYPVVKEGENALWVFDLKNREWVDPKPRGSCGSNSYNTNISVMEYDVKGDRVLVFRHGGEKKEVRGIWVYDPGKNSWDAEKLGLPEWRGECKNAYYDSKLNVYVFHCAGDSAEDGGIWVYRYRR